MASDTLKFRPGALYRWGLVAASAEAISAVALLATSAYLISRASQQPPILYLMVAIVGVRAFALGRATFRYLQRLAMHDAVFRELSKIRPKLFLQLARLVPGTLSSRGKALESVTTDVEKLQDWPLRVLVPSLQALAAILTMFAISLWAFAFAAIPILLATFTCVLLILIISRFRSSALEGRRNEHSQLLREQLVGYLSNIDVLESYGKSAAWIASIDKTGKGLAKLDALRVIPVAATAATFGLASTLIVAISGFVVGGGFATIDPATLAVALLMPLAVFDVVSSLQTALQSWQIFKQARTRLEAVVELEPSREMKVEFGDRELDSVSSLRCEDLAVSRAGKQVIAGLNFDFRSPLTAIVGHSGVGKSSLALTLTSLIQNSSGRILVNDQPLTAFSLESRRRQILLIEQHPHIFRGSVRQNLAIAGSDDEASMLGALSLVGLDFELAERGMLDAEISEAAQNISGGQAGRLAIARGLLCGASVLILDEPTSGLDQGNALALIEILRQISARGIKVILITHDLQLAGLCDETLDLTELATK